MTKEELVQLLGARALDIYNGRVIQSCARGYPVWVLELRDPADGLGPPETKTRYHYTSAGGRIWARQLPPAPLTPPGRIAQSDPARDEWHDDPDAACWRPWTPSADAASVLQALAAGLPLVPPPLVREEELDIHGDGGAQYTVYVMGPGSWSAITDRPCPVEDCEQTLVWYEAGYVPGYRVCMARRGTRYDPATLRHRFVLHPHPHGECMELVREFDRE